MPATIGDIDKLKMLKTWWWRYYIPQLLSAAFAKEFDPGIPGDAIVRSAEVIDLNSGYGLGTTGRSLSKKARPKSARASTSLSKTTAAIHCNSRSHIINATDPS